MKYNIRNRDVKWNSYKFGVIVTKCSNFSQQRKHCQYKSKNKSNKVISILCIFLIRKLKFIINAKEAIKFMN